MRAIGYAVRMSLNAVATVIGVNPSTGRIALRTEVGKLVVAEVYGDAPGVGEKLRGGFDQHGGQSACSVSSGEQFDLFIEAIDCSLGIARQLLGG